MSNDVGMNQDAKSKFIPKLRFPEFRDGLVWQETKLGELVSTVTPPKKLPTSSYLEKGMFPIIDQSQQDICGWTNDDEALIKAPLPLIVFGDHTCVLKFVRQPFAQGADGIKILNSTSGVSNEYLFQFLNFRPVVTEEYKRHFSILQQRRVFYSDIKIGEQQKIAECLTTLDEVIAAQSQRLDALKTYKKGLMQQLFPREGETLPRLRFPEFQDAQEWEEKKLGSVGDVLMCKRIFASETNDKGGVPFYKIGTLDSEPDAYISRELFEDYKSRYNFPRVGEVLITCSGTVGKCLQYDGDDAYYQDSNIVWIDNPTHEVSNELLLRILSNVNWGKLNSTTITRIYGPDLRGLLISFPADRDEQHRIASCLSSLDELIAAQYDKIEALKTHKKGLMQQLFPSPEKGEV